MKKYHKNPRQITKRDFEDLGESLATLGDLGGIVHDLNSDEIIGGNQRSEVFNINNCQIELVQEFEEPDEQGTVALGFVIWQGKRYAYRQVRWTEKQCEEANIRANQAGGSFDFDKLANEFELSDLLDWGIKEWQLGIVNDIDYDEEWQGMPEFEGKELAFRSLHLHFASQEDIDEFAELIDQKITDKTKSIWYPYKEKRDIKSLGYVTDEP